MAESEDFVKASEAAEEEWVEGDVEGIEWACCADKGGVFIICAEELSLLYNALKVDG